ncbi:MAG: hypothetical protein WAW41_09370 [Methylobacter sp.]
MNNKFVKKALILVLSFIAQTAFSNTVHPADALSRMTAPLQVSETKKDYSLPPSKVHIESCRQEALRLHPGTIENQRLLHRHGNFSMRFQIQADDGFAWFVQCDLANGKIIEAF